jgi:ABC-type dipeptide/oligopeptide/nickel transport system ATPase subunit
MSTEQNNNEQRTEMVAVRNLTLRLPQSSKTLVENLDLSIMRGERLIISGASGSGKSTLVRAIRDLWESGTGEIILPEGAKILVASQKAYAPNTSLQGVMCAPLPATTYSSEDVAKALVAVGRGNMIQYLPGQTTAAIMRIIAGRGLKTVPEMKEAATAIIDENVTNLQTVTDAEKAQIESALGDKAQAAELIAHIEREYARDLCERIEGWAVPGLVTSYNDKDNHANAFQSAFINWRLKGGLEKGLGKALTAMWTPKRGKHADWLGGAQPSKEQVAYISERVRESVAKGLEQNRTANYGMNSLGRAFGMAATTARLPGVLLRGVAYPFSWAAQTYTLAKPLALVGGALWLASKPFDVVANITHDLLVKPMKRTAAFDNIALRGLSGIFNVAAYALSLPRLNSLARKTGKGIATAVNGELSQEIFNGRVMSNRLSGGEQQRIIFARALLHKPDILILDEVTAALDKPAAQKLYDDLVKALPDTTIISIAHNEHVIPYHTKHGHLDSKKITVRDVAP